MNWFWIAGGILVLVLVAFSLLRINRTKEGLIKVSAGIFSEPWRYYLGLLTAVGFAIFFIVSGLLY
jgi:hypothetical protein